MNLVSLVLLLSYALSLVRLIFSLTAQHKEKMKAVNARIAELRSDKKSFVQLFKTDPGFQPLRDRYADIFARSDIDDILENLRVNRLTNRLVLGCAVHGIPTDLYNALSRHYRKKDFVDFLLLHSIKLQLEFGIPASKIIPDLLHLTEAVTKNLTLKSMPSDILEYLADLVGELTPRRASRLNIKGNFRNVLLFSLSYSFL